MQESVFCQMLLLVLDENAICTVSRMCVDLSRGFTVKQQVMQEYLLSNVFAVFGCKSLHCQ